MLTALELAREGWKPYLEAAGRRSSPPEPTSVERSERARLLGPHSGGGGGFEGPFCGEAIESIGSGKPGGGIEIDILIARSLRMKRFGKGNPQ